MIYINKHGTTIYNLDKFAYISMMNDPTNPKKPKYQIIGRYVNGENYTIIEEYDNEEARDKTFNNIIASIYER